MARIPTIVSNEPLFSLERSIFNTYILMLTICLVGYSKSAYILFYQPTHFKHFKWGTYKHLINYTSSFLLCLLTYFSSYHHQGTSKLKTSPTSPISNCNAKKKSKEYSKTAHMFKSASSKINHKQGEITKSHLVLVNLFWGQLQASRRSQSTLISWKKGRKKRCLSWPLMNSGLPLVKLKRG